MTAAARCRRARRAAVRADPGDRRRGAAPRRGRRRAGRRFPGEVFRLLGRAGLLGLPYPEEYGGGGQPYEVYLQVSRSWPARG